LKTPLEINPPSASWGGQVPNENFVWSDGLREPSPMQFFFGQSECPPDRRKSASLDGSNPIPLQQAVDVRENSAAQCARDGVHPAVLHGSTQILMQNELLKLSWPRIFGKRRELSRRRGPQDRSRGIEPAFRTQPPCVEP